jgi:hypothetical protein
MIDEGSSEAVVIPHLAICGLYSTLLFVPFEPPADCLTVPISSLFQFMKQPLLSFALQGFYPGGKV